MWSLFKRLWNAVMDLFGFGNKFENTDCDDDAFEVDWFARARNILRQKAKKGEAKEGALQEAMDLLWQKVPRDVAIHGEDIRANLDRYWENSLLSTRVPASAATAGDTASASTVGHSVESVAR